MRSRLTPGPHRRGPGLPWPSEGPLGVVFLDECQEPAFVDITVEEVVVGVRQVGGLAGDIQIVGGEVGVGELGGGVGVAHDG